MATRKDEHEVLAEQFVAMTQKDFYVIVDNDVRGRLRPTESAALRSNAIIVERWHSTLTGIKRAVEGTLAARKSETKANRLDALAYGDQAKADEISKDYHRWRAGALRFSTGVAEKLTEAKTLRAYFFPDRFDSAAIEERNALHAHLEGFMNAVKAHRKAILTGDGRQATEADDALWGQILR